MRNKLFCASAKLTLIVAVMLCFATVRAIAMGYATVNGIRYYLYGNSAIVSPLSDGIYVGCIVIPSEITYNAKTYKVTSIEMHAFSRSGSLMGVVIPEGVTSIGGYAFQYSSGLEGVTIPKSVTSIGESAFRGCSSLTGVTIPEGVTSINSETFRGCSSLTGVTIPEGVTSIGEYAFSGCTALKEVWVHGLSPAEASEKSFSYDAYKNATLYVPADAEDAYRKDAVWSKFKNLKTFKPDIPIVMEGEKYVAEVDQSGTLFSGHDSSEALAYKSLTVKGDINGTDLRTINTFRNLTELDLSETNIVEGGSSYYNEVYGEGYFASKDYIGPFCFNGLGNLKKIVLPKTLKLIETHILLGPKDKITLYSPFASLESLLEVVISNGEIGYGAFYGCNNLKYLTIGEGVTGIGIYAFNGCGSLKSVTIPESVTSVGDYAFRFCTGLTSVRIPHRVERIGEYAFSGCSGLKSVAIPESVTFIGYYAFSFCNSLASVTVPEGVKFVLKGAFANCSGLTSVSLPNSLNSLGDLVFDGCAALKEVWVHGLSPAEASEKSFSYDAYKNATLYVPADAEDAYRKDAVWSKFKSIKTFAPNDSTIVTPPIPDLPDTPDVSDSESYVAKVEQVGTLFSNHDSSEALYYKALTVKGNINGPDIMTINKFKNVETLDMTDAIVIGGDYYYYVSASENILAVDNVLGHFCFRYMNKLRKVMLPASLREFKGQDNKGRWPQNDSPFASPATLEEVVVNGGKIGECAFMKCTGLKRVILGEGVTDITDGALGDCSNITEVWNYGLTPLKLSVDVFCNDTYANATLYVPAEALAAYKADAVWSWFKNIKAIEATGIAAPTAGSVTVRRLTEGGLAVEGVSGMLVTVTDAGGRIVSRGQTVVTGLSHGLYIVRVGRQTYKVVI